MGLFRELHDRETKGVNDGEIKIFTGAADAATYSMAPSDRLVVADSTTVAVTINLPPKNHQDVIGNLYVVEAPAGATNDVSVNDLEAGSEVSSGGDLDAAADYSVFLSTGTQWIVVATSV